MTTMIDTLLAKAIEREAEAKALRLAAKVLTDTRTTTKQATVGAELQAAITLRQAQRPTPATPERQLLRPQQYATKSDIQARLQLMREALATGPKSTVDLMRVLQQHGATIGRDRVRQLLHEHMSGEVRQAGGAHRSRWSLKATRARRAQPPPRKKTLSLTEKRRRDRERKRVARLARAAAPARTHAPRNKQASLAKARTVAQILQAQGPLSIKELSQAARAAGLTKGLTGIHNFVTQGFIKRDVRRNGKARGKTPTYAFVAMPPPADATTPA